MMIPVPSEQEVRQYFNTIYRHPDDKELVYPIKRERPPNDKAK